RLAEILLMALNGRATKFSCVRFGTVLGSSGSVVPLFEEQIAAGGPVTVTHPDMKRYFMTVQEAVTLVLKAAAQDTAAIFTLDMGKSIKITDLAEEMIRARGLEPYSDIKIVFTGVRPGEKLFEELDVSEKNAFKTGHARIFVCKDTSLHPDPARLLDAVRKTLAECTHASAGTIRKFLDLGQKT
ncbi:MAG: polysaccharide biosynthesis protein, partial [Kiritimatiellae bacterium]|nr:polysaccharide biosynthesis protein [Kiritimatiellia bacterium]